MPPTDMNPMPPNVVQQLFPNDMVETEKDIENEAFSRETARNMSILAEWDDDFDNIIDNYSDEGAVQLPKRRRKQMLYKQRGRGRGNSLSLPRKTRRQSSIFGSAERGRSLLAPTSYLRRSASSTALARTSATIRAARITNAPASTGNNPTTNDASTTPTTGLPRPTSSSSTATSGSSLTRTSQRSGGGGTHATSATTGNNLVTGNANRSSTLNYVATPTTCITFGDSLLTLGVKLMEIVLSITKFTVLALAVLIGAAGGQTLAKRASDFDGAFAIVLHCIGTASGACLIGLETFSEVMCVVLIGVLGGMSSVVWQGSQGNDDVQTNDDPVGAFVIPLVIIAAVLSVALDALHRVASSIALTRSSTTIRSTSV
jgi:hypothetical protein